MPVKIKIQNPTPLEILFRRWKFVFLTGLVFGFWICSASASEHPRYEITASLDTAHHKISAQQKVVFTNNSHQEVKEICFHLYPHRKYTEKEIRFIYRYAGYFKVNPYPEGFQSGDLKIESVSSATEPLEYSIEGKDETILKVNLDAPLGPGASQEINLDFKVDIPHSFGRFGWHKEIITLVRWYPLLSVWDEEGWHNYPFYIYHQPYFSDAADYQVKLTLPKEQIVASTGFLEKEVINSDGTKTLYIKTDFPVRDFGLGISKDFLIHSLKEGKLKINAYYLEGDLPAAKEATQNALDLMRFYSQNFGEYPYSEFNLVPSYLAYAGCQSSGLVFIDTRAYKLPGFLERYFDFLISHESGHQWFYNLIGSDEYKEMFLDEGMNSYWVLRHLENKYGLDAQIMVLPKSLKWFIPNFSFRDSTIARYLYLAKHGLDRPIIGKLSSFKEPSSIFALTYGKGAAVLGMLESQIGKDVFTRIMQRYAREFRFKNISLKEFIRICNEESGQDLNWFFDDWLKTKKNVDFAIKKIEADKIILENRGSLSMPVKIKIVYQDDRELIQHWDGKEKSKVIRIEDKQKIKQVVLDPDNLIALDLDRTNNYWPRNLQIKSVPLYFFAYEIPVFLPRSSYNLVLGPSVGGSSLGVAASLQRPDDHLLRLLLDYDFNGRAVKSTLGYEFRHLFNQQTALGFEIFNYASAKEKQDVLGGKVYLRRELWPASYGFFELNDHVTLYLIRDQRLDRSGSGISGKEDIEHLYYRKKDEAIVGITGSLGRYGPYPDPDYGFKFMPTQEFGGHFLGGNESFWRTTLELNNYRLILPQHQHKLASRIKFGWGESSDKKLFQLGGPDGLRGYGRKTIEGAHVILGGLEYRFPLKSEIKFYFLDNIFNLDKIQAVGFFDLGKAWYADFSDTDFKKDIGLGLRFHFDISGLLEKLIFRIDVARALNDSPEDTHVWLGISHTF